MRGQEPRPWWRRAPRERRSSDPISWSSIDKCLALGGATVVVRGLGLLSNAGLRRSEALAPFLDRAGLDLADRFLLAVVAGWAALLVVGAALRPRRESPTYVVVTLVWFWATHATYAASTGFLTGTFWVDQVAAAMILLLLFGARPTYLGMIPGVLLTAAVVVAERMRVVPYAPVFRSPPFDAAGHPIGAWMLVQLAASVLLGGGSMVVVHVLLRRIREHEARLEELGTTDLLTGLRNRRGFRDAAAVELSRAQRDAAPVSVVMLDVDHFKRVNDSHGHAVGDALLAAVADALRAEVREHDVVGRYGGEEFVALLSGVSPEQARQVAERLRQGVAARAVAAGDQEIHVTATLGLATWIPEAERQRPDLDLLVRRADEAMYRGKQEGRDRVVVA